MDVRSLLCCCAFVPASLFLHRSSAAYGPVAGPTEPVVPPLELLRFGVEHRTAEAVYLNWTAIATTEDHRFEVERSADGVAFVSIGTMPAIGAAGAAQHYGFVDRSPLGGPAAYRLRLVAENGTHTLSTVRTVHRATATGPTLAFPDPVRDVLPLADAATTRVEVFDAAGERMPVSARSQGDGLDIGQLPAGTYYVRAGQRTARFTKE